MQWRILSKAPRGRWVGGGSDGRSRPRPAHAAPRLLERPPPHALRFQASTMVSASLDSPARARLQSRHPLLRWQSARWQREKTGRGGGIAQHTQPLPNSPCGEQSSSK